MWQYGAQHNQTYKMMQKRESVAVFRQQDGKQLNHIKKLNRLAD